MYEQTAQTGVPAMVPLLYQLPLEFPHPHPHPQEVWLASPPVASHGACVPSTSCTCSRSKTRLMKEKQEGTETHSTSDLPFLHLLPPRRLSCAQAPDALLLLKNESPPSRFSLEEERDPRAGCQGGLCATPRWRVRHVGLFSPQSNLSGTSG